MDVKSRNGEKFEIFSTFLAHRVETPWPILTILHQNVRRSVTTFGIAEKNRNGSCPMHEWDHSQFFAFLTPPPPPPRGRWAPQGVGHVGRHCPYTNNIWCGFVQAMLRYRSKTAKMQKFSAANWDIWTKFGLLIDFDLLKAATLTNMKPEVVFSGRGRHFEK